MFESVIGRMRAGKTTASLPFENLPKPFRGMPEIDPDLFRGDTAEACARVCETQAIDPKARTLDLGRCVFCGLCEEACGSKGIRFSPDPRLPYGKKAHLLLGEATPAPPVASRGMRSLLGRSLHLREVSAGGCNGCDLEVQALGNPVFDLQRFGIDFVASPRHADGLLVTGPVSRTMKEALIKTYDAIAEPRIVIAAGACAISGGIFRGSYAVEDGVANILPVDVHIPGCPPHPITLLSAILGFFGRVPGNLPRKPVSP
jgi:Ni,Fe-hydrogenase III small subunit/NAD-dependent dihydropyrimidine dehydrogenase PreA subunit